MQYKANYRGINNFGESIKENRVRKLILSLIFIITLITTVIIATSNLINNFNDNIILSKEEIQSYINITDDLSKAFYQLNWQEVAAINYVMNNESFEINNDNVNKIGNALIKKDSDGNAVGINTFKSALKSLDLSSEQEDMAINKLKALTNNYINEKLANDSNKLKFIDSVSEVAYDNYKSYGILPSITISQAILESGWGKSTLSSEYNNLFGIKADSRWNGESVEMETKENYDDVIVGVFRAYDSFKASIKDHGKFLYENARYANSGLFEGRTYKEQAEALENAGYSTSKDEEGNLIYADKLIRVIQENNLMFYDTIAQRN